MIKGSINLSFVVSCHIAMDIVKCFRTEPSIDVYVLYLYHKNIMKSSFSKSKTGPTECFDNNFPCKIIECEETCE